MIVGDSISAGPGCYKRHLLANLTANDYSSFDFVGEYTDDCGGGVRHSAVSCSTAEQYTQPTFTMPNCSQGVTFSGMSTLVVTHRPDMVMLQLGVNDVWNGRSPDAILGNYAKLVQQARAQNPNVVIVVAQIAKMRPDCSADDTILRRAESLVNAVPAWAESVSQPEAPVFVADLWTNSDWAMTETLDCVHPNEVGAQRMGDNWFDALRNILTPN
jgi:GDSL-like Lipase/Acylhydrolase family